MTGLIEQRREILKITANAEDDGTNDTGRCARLLTKTNI